VKIVANDEGNNWLWRRFVGKPHPGMNMTNEWVKKNVGLREELYQPMEAGADLFVGDLVRVHEKRHLVEKIENGNVFVSGRKEPLEAKDVQVIIQRLALYAFTHENLSLNQQNLQNARGVSTALREKYILGKVDTQTGLLFPEFDPGVHVIPQDEIPFDWKIIVGIDHGFDHPTAAVAVAMGRSGELIVFDEYAARNLSPQENAYEILEMIGGYERIEFRADTQMWNVDPRSPGTIADDYINAGVRPLNRANKNRELSIARLKDYLTARSTSIYEPDPKPRLFVMDNCSQVIKTLHYMQWDDFRGKRNDDILDALRYAVMAVYNMGDRAPEVAQAVQPKPFYTWR